MNRILILLGTIMLFGACQESLEDRAAREVSEYTKKNCPTPVINNQQLDSIAFEPSTKTIHYYYKLYNDVDNADIINKNKKTIRTAQLKDLKSNTTNKTYKDAGFNFQYTYRSASKPNDILFDAKFTKKDYK